MTDFCLNFVGNRELVLSMNISSSNSKLEMLGGNDGAVHDGGCAVFQAKNINEYTPGREMLPRSTLPDPLLSQCPSLLPRGTEKVLKKTEFYTYS